MRRLQRERGLTYAQIAKELGCSWSTVYYALNPEKRKGWGSVGTQRTVYLDQALWDALGLRAAAAGVSRSAVLAAVLVGESAPLTPEPAIPSFEGQA